MQTVLLYFKLISVTLRMQMQHRASFLMLITSYFIATLFEILGIWILFDRFHLIQGWTIQEIALLYGIMNMGFSFAETYARGFDTFDQLVKMGDFDRILLRPLGTLFQIATREVQWMRMGRFIQGLIVLLWGTLTLDIGFFSYQTLIIVLAIIGTSCLFYGLIVIQATLSFWATESLELMSIATFGGMESGQYPMSIYNPWFQWAFTFIIPLACVAYYPIAVAIRHESLPSWVAWCFPFAGVIFLYLSCQLWRYGVRHYHSTGN